MSRFTGRRNTGNFKRVGGALLDGLGALGAAMSDAPKKERIAVLDQQIFDLQQERDHLILELHEPGNLEVSADYDPNWRKPNASTLFDDVQTDGRLTNCGGSYDAEDTFGECHPGCPYKGSRHNEHQFTLND